MSPPFLSVAQVADKLQMRQHAVLALIANGELRAVNVAIKPNGKKPRWRIMPDDFDGFLLRRMHQAPPPRRRKCRKKFPEIEEFYK